MSVLYRHRCNLAVAELHKIALTQLADTWLTGSQAFTRITDIRDTASGHEDLSMVPLGSSGIGIARYLTSRTATREPTHYSTRGGCYCNILPSS